MRNLLTIKNASDPGRPLHVTADSEAGTVTLALGEGITACSIQLSRTAVNELIHFIEGDTL